MRSAASKEQVEAAGGEMVEMSLFKYVTVDIPNALHMKQTNYFGDILKADVVINVPIAKVHDLSRLTLGMKNLMGLVRDRPVMHAHLSQNLADLASFVRPGLTVVDAVRVFGFERSHRRQPGRCQKAGYGCGQPRYRGCR